MPDGTARTLPQLEMPAKANRPHYHVWIFHRTGRMSWRLARGFHTKQAANQWAGRNRAGEERMVRACTNPRCAPKL